MALLGLNAAGIGYVIDDIKKEKRYAEQDAEYDASLPEYLKEKEAAINASSIMSP